ncbi:MAG: agmatine deiminase family protein [Rhodobacterales bacterium]
MKRRGFLTAIAGAAMIAKPTVSATKFGLPTGYMVPAEGQPHRRTFMQWPNSATVYPDTYFLRMTQKTIAEIANTIAQFEPVVILAEAVEHARIRKLISGNIALWDIPTEDLWSRDTGPLFARHPTRGLAISNLNFNGWGDKQVHLRDNRIAPRVAERLGLPIFDSGLQGEPGGVEQDGLGSLIAHESSWLINNRNLLPKPELEQRLLAAYGASKMIWAKGLRRHDITDYHIDGLMRFIGDNRALIQLPEKPDIADPWARAALKTYEKLKQARDANGKPFDITVIPAPTTTRIKSDDFAALYANFYLCNGAVIAAEFGDSRTDAIAKETLQSFYPEREVITLNVDTLGELGGGIHCATQQQPAL